MPIKHALNLRQKYIYRYISFFANQEGMLHTSGRHHHTEAAYNKPPTIRPTKMLPILLSPSVSVLQWYRRLLNAGVRDIIFRPMELHCFRWRVGKEGDQ